MYIPASADPLGEVSNPKNATFTQKLVVGGAVVGLAALAIWAFRSTRFSAADIATLAIVDALVD